MTTTGPVLTKKDFQTDQEVRWCPGCGDYAILSAVQSVFPELGVPREKLVIVSDTHGIRRDVNDPESRVSHLDVDQIDEMVKNGTISSGMLPKVEACVTALRGGVTKAHIIDGRIPHALLLEIYTTAGIGTEIVLN